MKLLIVEDELKTANFLKRGFGEAGFTVSIAPDGSEGMRQIQSGASDLIVLDIMLPGMDGWSLLTWMRGSGIETPVIVLTARDQTASRVSNSAPTTIWSSPLPSPNCWPASAPSCAARPSASLPPCASLTWNSTWPAIEPPVPGSGSI